MSRQVLELETVIQQLIAEHQKLSVQLESQQAAMKAMNMKAIDLAVGSLEATRLRITTLENKRRAMVVGLCRLHNVQGNMRLTDIARCYPQRSAALLKLRADLNDILKQTTARSHVAGKVAKAVLGHLNTVVRLLAGLVEQAGLYTKQGVPQVAPRVGVMDARG